MPSLPPNASLLIHSAGLIGVFAVYGLCQEAILTKTYGPAGEQFSSSALLILCNRVFSVVAGLVLLLGTTCTRRDGGSFGQRVKPASAWTSYALVAVFNFLSTTCQYEALKYVSYTTSALAKCSKMVPVLVISAGLYKRKHQQKDWVAAAVIVAGCATYLFSAPPVASSHATEAAAHTAIEGALGAALLCGYLAFDGLTSTMQERMFGKTDNSADPFGPSSPVLNQMIWTNVWSSAIAVVVAWASQAATGSLLPNLALLVTSPALARDVLLLSAASTFGVLILLSTIASFGALQASLIMSIRQFVSILANATLLGTADSIALEGWCGIGWVASGVWIKISGPKECKQEQTHFDHDKEYAALNQSASQPPSPRDFDLEPATTGRQALKAYLTPLLAPFVASLILSVFTLGRVPGALVSEGSLLGGTWDRQLFRAVQPSCPAELDAVPYNASVRTGFVSYPRSGNSYVRSLIERASGFQTTSIYCDTALEKTFHGECDHDSGFFVKDHTVPMPQDWWNDQDYHRKYDQIVHVVRNPLDAVHSYWNLNEAMKAADANGGTLDHTWKAKQAPLGTGEQAAQEWADVLDLAKYWAAHALYWSEAPTRSYTLRYEDLTAQPVAHVLGMLAFVLPAEDLPAIDRVVCLAQENEHAEAYHSAKVAPFAGWDKYEPRLRQEVLRIVRRPFCQHGYGRMLEEARGALPEMAGFCDEGVAFPAAWPPQEWTMEVAAGPPAPTEAEEASLEAAALGAEALRVASADEVAGADV